MTEDVKNILYELKITALNMHQAASNLAAIVEEIETGVEPESNPEIEKYYVIANANKRLEHIKCRYDNLKEHELALWGKLRHEYKKEL